MFRGFRIKSALNFEAIFVRNETRPSLGTQKLLNVENIQFSVIFDYKTIIFDYIFLTQQIFP